MKLPLFNDEKDDLDAYLIRFEGACTAFEIRPEFWSTQLARLLQGRSLDVYQRLPAEEVDNYESLKTQLLKRFHLTEGGYCKKFKMSKLEVGETPRQFVERLNRYLVKWCEMVGYDDDYDRLKSLIIRDQVFVTCDRQLQTFLKEKGKLSLKEMAKAANDFYEARGYLQRGHNGNMKQPTLNTVNHRNTQPPSVTHAGTRHCDNCGLNNHNTNECRRLQSSQNNTNNDIVCFKCNRPGHKRLQCPMNVNRIAAMYQMNDQEAAMSNYPYGELRNCDESRGDGEVKLACGCMLPVVAGALSLDGPVSYTHLTLPTTPYV